MSHKLIYLVFFNFSLIRYLLYQWGCNRTQILVYFPMVNIPHKPRTTFPIGCGAKSVAMHFRWPLASSHECHLFRTIYFLRFPSPLLAVALALPGCRGNNILRRYTSTAWNGFCRWLGRLLVRETMVTMITFKIYNNFF